MVTTSNSLAIVFPVSSFRSGEDIALAVEADSSVQKLVLDIESRFAGTVNVAKAMTELSQVGSLLQLAYSSSKGFPCSVKIVAILSKYQTLIKDSSQTCNTFVDACLTALKLHKLALGLAEKDKTSRSIQQIIKTGNLAKEMAKVSGDLVTMAKNLCDMSEQGLIAATQDETVTVEKKQQVEKMVKEFEASQKNLDTKLEQLHEDIAERTKAVEKAQAEATDARNKAFALSMVSAFIQPLAQVATSVIPATAVQKVISQMASLGVSMKPEQVSQINDITEKAFVERAELSGKEKQLLNLKQKISSEENAAEAKKLEEEANKVSNEIDVKHQIIKSLEDACKKVENSLKDQAKISDDKESAIQTKVDELKKEKREANAQLQESIVRLKNANIDKNDLIAAINSLEVAVKTLGRIKYVFENVRQFWTGVEKHCNKLASVDAETLEDYLLVDKDEFVQEIKESGLNWLALGRINYIASNSIKTVEGTVDNIMCNLPTKKEAADIVKKLSDTMLAELEIENKSLKN